MHKPTIERETIEGKKHISHAEHPEYNKPIDLYDGVKVNFAYDHVDFFGGYEWKAGETALLTKPEAERALYEGHGFLEPVIKLRSLRSFRDTWVRDNINEFAPEYGCNFAGLPYYATEAHAADLMASGLVVSWDEWEDAKVEPSELYESVAKLFAQGAARLNEDDWTIGAFRNLEEGEIKTLEEVMSLV